jgi:hypothetical protein
MEMYVSAGQKYAFIAGSGILSSVSFLYCRYQTKVIFRGAYETGWVKCFPQSGLFKKQLQFREPKLVSWLKRPQLSEPGFNSLTGCMITYNP